jgi:DNA repair ATPase RecN
LNDSARVTEIARMLGGDPESEVSKAHAAELLETASNATGSGNQRKKTRS